MVGGDESQHADAGRHRNADLIPPEFLRVIAVWSLVPAYVLAGAFVGYLLDRWFGTFPYLLGLGLLVALVMSVRDMFRLRNEFQRPGDDADES